MRALLLQSLFGEGILGLHVVLSRTSGYMFVGPVTVGTLAARKDALEALIEASSARPILGMGYAASSWVADKFGEAGILPANYSSHNAIVEQVWYVGLPGLALFAVVLGLVGAHASRVLRSSDPDRCRRVAIITGYLLGLFVTGLGNGEVFLGYYFFFFAGAIVGEAHQSVRAEGSA